jgi:acyl-CoA synthetase (AMP-forming)/AMP-acid ligase II/acyl carrier protein
MSEALTLLDLIHRWGEERPDRTAFRFLRSDESIGEEVSYAALRRNTFAIARALSAYASPDSRALLLFETEPGFVHAFFGCLAAQVLAVPADPPHGRRAWGGIDRIVRDCRPAIILTTRMLQQRWDRQLAQLSALHACRVLTIEECLADGDGAVGAAGEGADQLAAVPAAITAARVAFLQYTSGSTSHPKGVMVTHANMLANVRMIQEAFALDADTRTVSWLPLFHDMGLIGFVMEPVYLGCTSTILSPAAFLEKPVRWLRAITRYRGTISSSPNFAYDLCCAKIRPEEREGLELSSWRCVLNGSEPVSARTIARFLETFADRGLQATAFRPCYGMAETTLLISANDPDRSIRLLPAPEGKDDDDKDRQVPSDTAFRIESSDAVSCGRPPRGTVIRIVDPVTMVECAGGQVGEVWFRGENVAAGYWENPAATEDAFGARLAGDERGTYLRTGDLGCLDEGELFLMGRMKELIIIRGRNFPPPDIEEAVAGVHEAIRVGHVAAVGVVHGTEQELAIVAEIEREHWRTFDPQAVVDAILEVIHAEFGLGVASVTLLRPGGIPKTTSGKLKRLECARRLSDRAASDWGVLHEWRLPAPAAGIRQEAGAASHAAAASGPRPVIVGLEKPELTDVVLTWLRARLAQSLQCSPDDIADEEPFARCGLDSAVAVTLTGELAEWLRLDLDPTVFWEHAHPLALSEYLAGQVAERAGAGDPVEQV